MNYRIRDIVVDGGSLAAAEWGPSDAHPILAIHGFTGSHLTWEACAEAMPDVRIIAPDLRGRGASSELAGPWRMPQLALDVIAVIDALGLDRVPLVGHSLGAFVANVTAHRHPDRVSGVLLVDGGLTLPLPHDLPAVATLPLGSSAEVVNAVAAIRPGTRLLVAPHGSRHDDPPIYPAAALGRWLAELPALEVVTVPGVNHHTIVTDAGGVAAVVEFARDLLGS